MVIQDFLQFTGRNQQKIKDLFEASGKKVDIQDKKLLVWVDSDPEGFMYEMRKNTYAVVYADSTGNTKSTVLFRHPKEVTAYTTKG